MPAPCPANKQNMKRILIVEDNPDTQTLLSYLLRSIFEIEIVSCVANALTCASEQHFDLFLLDINLGEQQTGLDLLHLLRKMPHHADTPALALTAYAMPGDRERFTESGFNNYLSKPFTRKNLMNAIELCLASLA